jgi:hypothetical protein
MFFLASRKRVIPQIATLLLCMQGVFAQTPATAVDSDHDGLSDEFEQALLEQYRPTFMINANDCAAKPARFKAGQAAPEVLEADGTIYGQVFPVSSERIEVHYYTLWDRDCGRNSHPLDAEHVSALITRDNGQNSKALYWYAGAHEQTVCDISSGAQSGVVSAEHHGPTVWSSIGKHALYLKEDMCNHGCGADSCRGSKELASNGRVINLGEVNAPANGANWLSSPGWALAAKMHTDYSRGIIALLDASPDNAITVRGRSPIRGVIQGSDYVAETAASSAQRTGAALNTANTETSGSLWNATKATARGLRRAWNAVFVRKQPQQ